jgi:hypothetical protein
MLNLSPFIIFVSVNAMLWILPATYKEDLKIKNPNISTNYFPVSLNIGLTPDKEILENNKNSGLHNESKLHTIPEVYESEKAVDLETWMMNPKEW